MAHFWAVWDKYWALCWHTSWGKLISSMLVGLLIAGPVGLLLGLIVVIWFWKPSRYATNDYKWYIENNPNSLKNKNIHCNHCDSYKILVRAADQAGYREHFCSQCGKTLYYSARDNMGS